jgi:hypothetical protein
VGLAADAGALARGRNAKTFARLVAGLVRVELAKDHDGVREATRLRREYRLVLRHHDYGLGPARGLS